MAAPAKDAAGQDQAAEDMALGRVPHQHPFGIYSDHPAREPAALAAHAAGTRREGDREDCAVAREDATTSCRKPPYRIIPRA